MNDIPSSLSKVCLDTIRQSFSDIFLTKSDKYIEIEARLGVILDRKLGTRIDLGASHPVILSSPKSQFYFQSGVSQFFFNKIHEILGEVKCDYTEEVVIIKNNLRIIYSNGQKLLMKKVKIKTVEIHFPQCHYDARISFSKEEVLENSKVGDFSKIKGNSFRRERNRTSFYTRFYRFDLTSIKTQNDLSYEVEVEIFCFDFDKNEFFDILKNMAS